MFGDDSRPSFLQGAILLVATVVALSLAGLLVWANHASSVSIN